MEVEEMEKEEEEGAVGALGAAAEDVVSVASTSTSSSGSSSGGGSAGGGGGGADGDAWGDDSVGDCEALLSEEEGEGVDEAASASQTSSRAGIGKRRKRRPMFCCYLLTPASEAKSGKLTYVGFTTEPPRRLRQHNGEIKGGARRTRKHAPWRMVCAVLGFPSKFSALSFEFAWQQPDKSRLAVAAAAADQASDAQRKLLASRMGKRSVKRKLLELALLLRQLPFAQFPLVVSFGADADRQWFTGSAEGAAMPAHMEVRPGPIKADFIRLKEVFCCDNALDASSSADLLPGEEADCSICVAPFESGRASLACTKDTGGERCPMQSHPVCLAKLFLEGAGRTALLPDKGSCPFCGETLRWAELVRDAKFLL